MGLAALAIWAATNPATAQNAFSSSRYQFRIALPADWAAQMSEALSPPSLYAVSADDKASLYLEVYEDSTGALEYWFEKWAQTLDAA
ncbi:MAG: hypothetical protein NZ534_13200, partial [Bacteroidia bacterium]|nr:hypothetical protein [Bacteroidia bacterium]